MLGGGRDIPAINPRGSCSPKSVPPWSQLPPLLPEGCTRSCLESTVECITDPPSWLSRKLSSPAGRRRAGPRASGARGCARPGGRRRSGPGRPSALLRRGSGRAPGAGPGRTHFLNPERGGRRAGRAGRGAAAERPPHSARGKLLRSPAGFPHRDPGGHGASAGCPPGLGPLPSGRAVAAARLVGSRCSPAFPAPLFRSAARSAGELRTRPWRQ